MNGYELNYEDDRLIRALKIVRMCRGKIRYPANLREHVLKNIYEQKRETLRQVVRESHLLEDAYVAFDQLAKMPKYMTEYEWKNYEWAKKVLDNYCKENNVENSKRG